jgi:hypothetical protein
VRPSPQQIPRQRCGGWAGLFRSRQRSYRCRVGRARTASLSSASVAHPAGDPKYVAAACQSHPDTLMDRPSTVDSQRYVPPRTRSAGGDPAATGEKLANDHCATGSLPARPAACGAGPWEIYERLPSPPPALQRRAVIAAPASAVRSTSVRGVSQCPELLQSPQGDCTSHCMDCLQQPDEIHDRITLPRHRVTASMRGSTS